MWTFCSLLVFIDIIKSCVSVPEFTISLFTNCKPQNLQIIHSPRLQANRCPHIYQISQYQLSIMGHHTIMILKILTNPLYYYFYYILELSCSPKWISYANKRPEGNAYPATWIKNGHSKPTCGLQLDHVRFYTIQKDAMSMVPHI
jgi:hypothetical protein